MLLSMQLYLQGYSKNDIINLVGRSKKGFITTSTQNELFNRLKKIYEL